MTWHSSVLSWSCEMQGFSNEQLWLSILVSCGFHNKWLQTGWLQTTEIYYLTVWWPRVWNQHTGRIGSFQGRVCSIFSPWLVGGHLRHRSIHICLLSWPLSVLSFLLLVRTSVILGLGHLNLILFYFFDLILIWLFSMEILSPNKLTSWDTVGEDSL